MFTSRIYIYVYTQFNVSCTSHCQVTDPIWCVDFFCGHATIAGAFAQGGFGSKAFDVVRSLDRDLSSPLGIVVGMIAVLALSAGSTLRCGTVCTSFCWINSGTHQRTAALPLGQTDFEYVALGNKRAAVTAPWLQVVNLFFFVFHLSPFPSTSGTMGSLGLSWVAKGWLRIP